MAGVPEAIDAMANMLPVVFPVHPRTRQRLGAYGFKPTSGVFVTEPRGYLDFLALLSAASLILTDSGGIQEESSVLGIPCLTLRENTERPITCELGTNRVVGADPKKIVEAATEALAREWKPANIPLWDGRAATRIARVLADA